MSRFLQLHILVAYPPSNPNRDDLGRPKTATIGGVMRQRMSSQAIKRAIRQSDAFGKALKGQMGSRTQRLGERIVDHLAARGADSETALKIAREVAAALGKIKSEKDPDPAQIEQLAFLSPDEQKLALDWADKAYAGEDLPKDKELAKLILQQADGAVDIAMFGRMLANTPEHNREAAVQVAHAFTVNRVDIEDDYYTAVDDLKSPEQDSGAGFVGEAGFGAGVYYLYVTVNRPLLLHNLKGDAELAEKGLNALVHALATSAPSGKRNSFANHVRPGFILAEKGDRQPRSLAEAFTVAVAGADQMREAVARLRKQRADFAAVYGTDWESEACLEVGNAETATLDHIAEFAAEGMKALAS